MALFGITLSRKRKKRRQYRRTGPWPKRAIPRESRRRSVEDLDTEVDPYVLAAVVMRKTGITIGPEHIKPQTPDEGLHAVVAASGLAEIAKDDRFIADAEEDIRQIARRRRRSSSRPTPDAAHPPSGRAIR